jgi:hypothetical protein
MWLIIRATVAMIMPTRSAVHCTLLDGLRLGSTADRRAGVYSKIAGWWDGSSGTNIAANKSATQLFY